MAGLPDSAYPVRLVPEGEIKSAYGIIIGGRNFGCGSSREHAPIALGAAGVQAVVAESFARIFFRNCVATGELYPYDSPVRLCDKVKTGDEATLDFDADTLTVNGADLSAQAPGRSAPRDRRRRPVQLRAPERDDPGVGVYFRAVDNGPGNLHQDIDAVLFAGGYQARGILWSERDRTLVAARERGAGGFEEMLDAGGHDCHEDKGVGRSRVLEVMRIPHGHSI